MTDDETDGDGGGGDLNVVAGADRKTIMDRGRVPREERKGRERKETNS